MFPLKDYKHKIPEGEDFGAFGVRRKYDIHTGVDLYCNQGDLVYAIEGGEIIAIEPFTGEIAGFPWWNDTWAIAILGPSGVINYGEIQPLIHLSVGDIISEGTILGHVIPVLKTDKGKVPSTNMLHMELYSKYEGKWIEWNLTEQQPVHLQNPTNILKSQ